MRKILFAILVLVVIAIGLLHFLTPGYLIFYHDMYRRLSYFPIVLGAIWFGVWGGLALAVMSSIAFIPHVLLYIGQETGAYVSELTEIVLYLAAGTVTGFIAGRESLLRRRYKELSEKLEKSYDKLHRETQLLLEAEEQLSAAQKLSALGQLSASLAHEIKNPLSSIKGTAEILLDEFPVGHPKREFVEILLKETTRLNNTVEEVLQFSRRGQPGRKKEDAANEPLSEVIERVTSLLHSQIRKKNITLSVMGWETGKEFPVASGKLSQVFLNIILNAIDATPVKGKITIETRKLDTGFTVSVMDTGPGIPAEHKDKIFDPFYSTKDGGTGLGLSISKKIIESYGGTLTLTDSGPEGARFAVFLPGQYSSAKVN
ncbi:MAG: HAMP domain-containing histidine kinase [Deltaproteobacteria bacterium]|jgi:signal transduction histidine kinase|nr:HAMP domain-containing histidine kinase [Deltaproteobacteria bacterium]